MKNHSLDYGDNIDCYLCCDVFDARNDPHDMIGNHFICNYFRTYNWNGDE